MSQTTGTPQGGRPIAFKCDQGSTLHNTVTQNNHSLYGHCWKPTWIQGERLCIQCGTSTYCPHCTGAYPHGAFLSLCPAHAAHYAASIPALQTEGEAQA